MIGRTLFAVSTVAFAIANVAAHETWLIPSSFTVGVGEEARFDLSSGMDFPRLESPIRTDRVARAMHRIGKDHASLKTITPTASSLSIRQKFKKAGVATVWVDLAPKDITLDDHEVAEYLDEIGASDALRAEWAARKGGAPWKETYTKHAKTFVAVGAPGDDRSWAEGVGSALEIVPVTSPFEVEAGGELTVELRVLGKPLAGSSIGLMIEGSAERVFRTTDKDGRATFDAVREGRALFFAVRLAPASEGSSWISDFCTMTLAIHGKNEPVVLWSPLSKEIRCPPRPRAKPRPVSPARLS